MTLLDRGQTVRRPSGPLAVSCAIHVFLFWWFVEAPSFRLPRAADSEYKQAVAGKEDRILWYRAKKLPAVTPPTRADKPNQPVRAESKSDQQLVAVRKNAPKRDQTVLSPAPELAVTPIDAPNLIAVRLPPKEFVAPPDLARPPPPAVAVPTAPELTAAAIDTARLPDSKLPPRPFVPPTAPEAARPLSQPKLAPEAPALEVAGIEKLELPQRKLPPRSFVAPSTPSRRTSVAVAEIPDAPQFASARRPGGPANPLATAPLPRVPQTAPQPPDLGGTAAPLDLAIVGLRPIDTALPPRPPSAPAALSGGPVVNPKGADSDGAGKGIPLPGLFVRGPVQPSPDLRSQLYAAPTAPENLRAALARTPGAATVVEDSPAPSPKTPSPSAAKVSSAPDPRLNGRDVYMMAIQMPNLTSYSGSWLMWYADSAARSAGLSPVSPPVAHRKVDPKYVATAVEEHVEGTVRLFCSIGRDGNVSAIEVVQGADQRLVDSAVGALAKWEFYPATRNGVPLDVDVVVEIPFRLAPRTPNKR